MEGLNKCVLLVVLIFAFSLGGGLATKLEVGGSQGWAESTDFSTWSTGQTFKVGDELGGTNFTPHANFVVFKYSSGLHSVEELPDEKAYKSCDIGSSLKSLNSGSDTIKLDKAGTRYFACGTSGHCDEGMKMRVTVGGGGSSSGSTTSGGSSSGTTPSTTSSAHESARIFGSFYVIYSLLAIQMVLIVLLA